VKVLVVDDSERLRRSLEHGLRRSGFAVDTAGDGEEGLAHARHGGYDVLVLDLMMPKVDGLTVLRRLRDERIDVHVLVLSAKDQVAERVEGLRLGADDYLTKPFDFDELVARLRALVRRRYGSKNPVHRLGALEVDTARRVVTLNGDEVHLTRAEYSLLEYLLARRGRVVPKQELLDHIYADTDQGSENALEVFVHQLRRKLEAAGARDVVHTRRGHGYVVEEAPCAPSDGA
jgi:DNA-binding response OmpR family regulator